jgi:hypothetical protein
MAGFSESGEGEKGRSGDSNNRSGESASNQFLSKVWQDLGYERPNFPNTQSTADKLPPVVIPVDAPVKPQAVPQETSSPARIQELRRLDHRSADHATPDAEVRLPANFDPTKPIHLVIYNHGWGSNVQTALKDNKLDEQMSGAPDNTVLIVPEWQRQAGANSGDQGRFKEPGMFSGMLQEIFDKTPELKGKSIKDVDGITIFAHSAGYGPAETEIYKNGLADKVKSIVLLDALYDNTGFDSWIKQNASELAAGTKQFYNFFYGTSDYSKQQAERVKRMLPAGTVLEDYNHGGTVMDASTLAKHPVVFKYSNVKVDGVNEHLSMPHLYVGPVETAARAGSDRR